MTDMSAYRTRARGFMAREMLVVNEYRSLSRRHLWNGEGYGLLYRLSCLDT